MKFELGFTINCDSTIQMSSNWCRKLKMVQQTKMSKEKQRMTENNTEKHKCFNINVTQGAENVNTNNGCCP